MALAYQAKTEVALTTNPQTIAHPTGTADGDYLVLVAACSTTALALSTIDLAKWRWSAGSVGPSSLTVLIGIKRFVTSDAAPSLVTNSTGYAAMYRYSGVTTARFLHQVSVTAATQDSPAVSATATEEILWAGVGRRTVTPAPGVTLSRGTLETNQNANFLTLVSYRENLAAGVSMVIATMSQTGTPTFAWCGAVVLSDEASYVYKGRDSAASDTTGAA